MQGCKLQLPSELEPQSVRRTKAAVALFEGGSCCNCSVPDRAGRDLVVRFDLALATHGAFQFIQGGVEMWGDVLPVRVVGSGGKELVHGDSLLFTILATLIGADEIGGEVLSGAMQPAG